MTVKVVVLPIEIEDTFKSKEQQKEGNSLEYTEF